VQLPCGAVLRRALVRLLRPSRLRSRFRTVERLTGRWGQGFEQSVSLRSHKSCFRPPRPWPGCNPPKSLVATMVQDCSRCSSARGPEGRWRVRSTRGEQSCSGAVEQSSGNSAVVVPLQGGTPSSLPFPEPPGGHMESHGVSPCGCPLPRRTGPGGACTHGPPPNGERPSLQRSLGHQGPRGGEDRHRVRLADGCGDGLGA